jgi:hypothetical protein
MLFRIIRINSVCFWVPVFAKIERNWARAVLGLMPRRLEASHKDRPFTNSRTNAVSAGVSLYKRWATATGASVRNAGSRTNTVTAGR